MRLTRGTDDVPNEEEVAFDRTMIVPLIKRAEPQRGAGVDLPEHSVPIMEPLTGDLFVGYVLDLEDSFQYVSRTTCDDLGVAVEELRSVAVRNLIHRRPKPEIKQGPLGVGFVLDGDLEASLLLVDLLWDQIDPQIPGDLIAAVPTRDVLMVTGSDVTGGTDALSSAITRVWGRSEERLLLTRSLLSRRDGSWHLLDTPAAEHERGIRSESGCTAFDQE